MEREKFLKKLLPQCCRYLQKNFPKKKDFMDGGESLLEHVGNNIEKLFYCIKTSFNTEIERDMTCNLQSLTSQMGFHFGNLATESVFMC